MTPGADAVTFSVPRAAVDDVQTLAASLVEKMHELLERNTEGTLSETERESLDTLVRMAQFAQIVSMGLGAQPAPVSRP
jgi:hypothetical protein